MMKVSKNGRRTIHLHNPSAVKYLEEYAEQNHVPMYKAMEMIIFELMTVDVVDSEEKYVSEAVLELNDYGSFVYALLCNDYKVSITPVAGVEKVIVTFEKKYELR